MGEQSNNAGTGPGRAVAAILWCAGALLALPQSDVRAQGTLGSLIGSAKRLPETELLPRLLPAFELTRPGYSQPFVIEGEHTFASGAVLVASEVIFKAGSKLILVPGPAQSGRDAGVFLITRRIVVEQGARPAMITWAGSATASSSPPPAGKGAPGSSGYDGTPGERGADGASGSPGTSGRSPPILYLATPEIAGGQLFIDWRGQDGGPGGTGQFGGDGGRGGSGKPASGGLFDCRRGPGDGGAGGNGGNGGAGGAGGRGGDGGLFVLLVMPHSVASLATKIGLDVSSGAGGYAGRGGDAGSGGPGGERGRAAPPFCQDDARRGADGRPGTPGAGAAELRGPQGAPGSLAVGELIESQARALGIVP